MPNPYTFVNWGVLGVTDKAAGTSQTPLYPGYKVTIFGTTRSWGNAQEALRNTHYHLNKRNLGYATPTQAMQFFNSMVYRIEEYNAITPVKKRKIRFLKSLSREPDWRKMEGGFLVYAFYIPDPRWGLAQYATNHRIFIHFKPYFPPKPKTPKVIKPFEQRIAELNYSHYGL